MQSDTILRLNGITKRFPGVVALDSVDLEIYRGETHVLLGENGAGKSTLVKILSGIYSPDAGEIFYDQGPFQPESPRKAMQAGIRLIHQELNLLNYLSVAENIFFEQMPNNFGIVDYKRLNAQAQQLLDEVGLDISPQDQVGPLSIAQKQMVEIAKALSAKNKLLIMDEPTASLTNTEIEKLFEIIRKLKARGVTIIYISHRLQEIFEIGDRLSVLRNGKRVVTESFSGATIDQIVKWMVGRQVDEGYPFRQDLKVGQEIFRVNQLRPVGFQNEISFAVSSGEILGIAGLVGAGRTEILRTIFGADSKVKGDIILDGKIINPQNPKAAVKHGISFLTENRKEEGLMLDMSCMTNISITNLINISQGGLLNFDKEKQVANRFVKDLSIRTPSPLQLVRNLSGGNQQKIVLAKWLFKDSKLLMVDEPTRGIDVGARFEIYQLLWDLASEGRGIILVSSDLPELMGLCHRILVISKGKLVGELDRPDFDQEKILTLAFQEYVAQQEQGL